MDYSTSVCRRAVDAVAAHTSPAHVVHRRESRKLKCYPLSCSLSQEVTRDAYAGKVPELTARNIFISRSATSPAWHFLFFMTLAVSHSLTLYELQSSQSFSEYNGQNSSELSSEKPEALMRSGAELLCAYGSGFWCMYNAMPPKKMATHASYYTASFDDYDRVFLELTTVNIFIITGALSSTERFLSPHFSSFLTLVVSYSLLYCAFYRRTTFSKEEYVLNIRTLPLEKCRALSRSEDECSDTYGSRYLSICHVIPSEEVATSGFDSTVESSAARDNEIFLTDTEEPDVEQPSEPIKRVDCDSWTTRQNEISLTAAEDSHSETPKEPKNCFALNVCSNRLLTIIGMTLLALLISHSATIYFLSLQLSFFRMPMVFNSPPIYGLLCGWCVSEEHYARNVVALPLALRNELMGDENEHLPTCGTTYRSIHDVIPRKDLPVVALYRTVESSAARDNEIFLTDTEELVVEQPSEPNKRASFKEKRGAVLLPSATDADFETCAPSRAIRLLLRQKSFVLQRSAFNSILSYGLQRGGSVHEEEGIRSIVEASFDNYQTLARSDSLLLGTYQSGFRSTRGVIQPTAFASVALFCTALFEEETGAFVLHIVTNAVIAAYARSRTISFLSPQFLFELQRFIVMPVLTYRVIHGGSVYGEESIQSIATVFSDDYQTLTRRDTERLSRSEPDFWSTGSVMQPTELAFVAVFCVASLEVETGKFYLRTTTSSVITSYFPPNRIRSRLLQFSCDLQWSVVKSVSSYHYQHGVSRCEEESNRNTVAVYSDEYQSLMRRDSERLGSSELFFLSKGDAMQPTEVALVDLLCAASCKEDTGTVLVPTATNPGIVTYYRWRAIGFLSLQVLLVLQCSLFNTVLSHGLQHGGLIYEEKGIGSIMTVSYDDYDRYQLGFGSARDFVQAIELALAALFCTASFDDETEIFVFHTASNAVIATYARSRAIRRLSPQFLFDVQPSVVKSVLSYRLQQGGSAHDEEECIRNITAVSSDDYQTLTRSDSERLDGCESGCWSTCGVIQPKELYLVAPFCTTSFDEELGKFFATTATDVFISSCARSSAMRLVWRQILFALLWMVVNSLLLHGIHPGESHFERIYMLCVVAFLPDDCMVIIASNATRLRTNGSHLVSLRDGVQPQQLAVVALYYPALFEEESERPIFAVGMATYIVTGTPPLAISFLSPHILCILQWKVLCAATRCRLYHAKSVYKREYMQRVVGLYPKDPHALTGSDTTRLSTYGSHFWSIRYAAQPKELIVAVLFCAVFCMLQIMCVLRHSASNSVEACVLHHGKYVSERQCVKSILALPPEDRQELTRSDTKCLRTDGARHWSICDIKKPTDLAAPSLLLCIRTQSNYGCQFALARKESEDSLCHLQTKRYCLPRYFYRAFYGELTGLNILIYAVVWNSPHCTDITPIQVEDLASGIQPVDSVETLGVQPVADNANLGAQIVVGYGAGDTHGDNLPSGTEPVDNDDMISAQSAVGSENLVAQTRVCNETLGAHSIDDGNDDESRRIKD